jgi:mRNA interferase RelE/StbE
MPYKVRLHREVVKTLERLSPELRSRIVRELRALEVNPHESRAGADIARLKGTKGREDLFRLRIGDYRVIYAVVAGIVYITDIFHRGKGYKQLL